MRSSSRARGQSLAAPFVVTVSSLSLGASGTACGPAAPPTVNEPRAEATSAPATGRSGGFVRRVANEHDPSGQKPVFVAKDASCYVEGAKIGERAPIACPDGVDVQAWAASCADQLVFEESTDRCRCEIFGNPPYIGTVPCPRHP